MPMAAERTAGSDSVTIRSPPGSTERRTSSSLSCLVITVMIRGAAAHDGGCGGCHPHRRRGGRPGHHDRGGGRHGARRRGHGRPPRPRPRPPLPPLPPPPPPPPPPPTSPPPPPPPSPPRSSL